MGSFDQHQERARQPWSSENNGAQRRLRLPADTAALAVAGRRKAESLMTADRLRLTAIAVLALAGAAHAQETDKPRPFIATKSALFKGADPQPVLVRLAFRTTFPLP